MTALDFPDFRPFHQDSSIFLGMMSGSPVPDFTFPLINTSAFESIAIMFQNTSGINTFKVQAAMEGDPTDPVPNLDYLGFIGTMDSGVWRLPTPKGSVLIDVIQVATGSTLPIYMSVYGYTSTPKLYDMYSENFIVNSDSSAYAAAGTKTINAINWYTGPASVMAYSDSGGPAHITLSFRNALTGTYDTFANIPVLAATASLPVAITVPPGPLRLLVTNGATAQNITVNVTPSALGGV